MMHGISSKYCTNAVAEVCLWFPMLKTAWHPLTVRFDSCSTQALEDVILPDVAEDEP
jgi:hypothetical protein